MGKEIDGLFEKIRRATRRAGVHFADRHPIKLYSRGTSPRRTKILVLVCAPPLFAARQSVRISAVSSRHRR